jgi:class 3 adenylate cyclase
MDRDREPLVVERAVECKNDVRTVWRILSNTDWMNRAVGMNPIAVRPLDDGSGAPFLITTRIGGFNVEYEERPFEFEELEHQSVTRVMRRGPVSKIRVEWTLSPIVSGGVSGGEPSGTHVVMKTTVWPRWRVLGPVVRLSTAREVARYVERIAEIDRMLTESGAGKGGDVSEAVARAWATALRQEAPPVSPAQRQAGDELQRSLREALKPLGKRLTEYIAAASEVELQRIRPFELADAWKVDRRDLAIVCLQAASAGLLELSWELVCPSCRVVSRRLTNLVELGADGHCQLCDIGFGLDFDRAVEAVFHPAPGVREVDLSPRCIGGAARTPHVVVQALLPPQGEVAVKAPSQPGRYRLFLRGGATASVEVDGAGAQTVDVRAGEGLEPGHISVAPGGQLTVKEGEKRERHVKIERLEWASTAATAHFMSTLPSFRQLFPEELLRTGLALRVTQASFLFTDLVASTALYSQAGDQVAFQIVLDHFDLLGGIIERHHGAVVKTMGDAVLGVFLEEKNALLAAREMVRAYPEFRQKTPAAADTDLKVGIHTGPCWAVTGSKTLDYFGQTLNLTARLMAQAHGGEIVMTHEMYERARQSGWIEDAKAAQRADVTLRGIKEPVTIARL